MRNGQLLWLAVAFAVFCSASCAPERIERQVLGDGGRSLAEVAMIGDLKDGPATLHLSGDGSKRGEYAHGLKHGRWVEINSNGDTLAIANYSYGRAHGLWQEFMNGRRVYLALYNNGVEQGPRIHWYSNGAPASLVRFKEGKEEGIAHRWEVKDTVNVGMHVTGEYVDGKPEGAWRRYYSDGVLCNENHYRNGLRDGIWTLWSRDGEVLRRIEYRFDKKVRTIVDRVK
ncbi:MAG: hypothetical protein ABI599_05450 [Flavobacteriales bacterium]